MAPVSLDKHWALLIRRKHKNKLIVFPYDAPPPVWWQRVIAFRLGLLWVQFETEEDLPRVVDYIAKEW